jgi:plasmid stabilization system protein ParE
MRRVVWTTTATADLIEIFTYIAADNSRVAEGVRQRIHKVASGLAYFATGRRIAVDDVYQQIVPRLPYLIIYRLNSVGSGDVIEILRVVHTAQDRSR